MAYDPARSPITVTASCANSIDDVKSFDKRETGNTVEAAVNATFLDANILLTATSTTFGTDFFLCFLRLRPLQTHNTRTCAPFRAKPLNATVLQRKTFLDLGTYVALHKA